MLNEIVQGDARELLKDLPSASVDLIFTSPPYGNARVHTYGGVEPDQYVEWFQPFAQQFRRVLKPDGSFVLNIKECYVDGFKHPYVMQLIYNISTSGYGNFRWVEEYIWHKTNCMPGRWRRRFRDAWERCLHFSIDPEFRMYKDAVKVLAKPATVERGGRLTEADKLQRNFLILVLV